jgi:NAD(P)-dependent dehydrogenase (short-subunit alcohol dehydrogenase family)
MVGKIQREAPRSHVEYYRADLASLDDRQAYEQSKLALVMLTVDLAVALRVRVSQPTPFTPQPS